MPDIDERVVRMQFDNAKFEQGVSKSLKTIDDLKKALNFDKTAESLKNIELNTGRWDFSKIENAAEKISEHFTIVGRVVDQVRDKLASIATQGLGKVIDGLETATGIKGYDTGFDKYANKSKAVRTIMSATGRSIEEVNEVLKDLMWYTDMTSYDFNEMVSSIGKFTSVGVELETAESAMEGIANWAARSGADKQKANQAMYNLSQAMGMGALKLQDWKSIEIANMGTKEFKETMIDTAIEMGILQKAGDHVGVLLSQTSKGVKKTVVDYTTFRETLKYGWADTEVMLNTFQKYKKGMSELGDAAFEDAKVALTFKDAMDAIQDALSSGWSQTYEALFGNAEEAGKMWTSLCDAIIEVVEAFSSARVEILETWHALGGYNDMLEIAGNLWGIVKDAISMASDTLKEVFPIFNITGKELAGITAQLKEVTAGWRKALGYVSPYAEDTEEAASSAVEAQQAVASEAETIAASLTNSAELVKGIDKELKSGMRSADVKKLQEFLKSAGYRLDKYGADGIYGPETRAAVQALQRDLGINVTGVWDEATRRAAEQSKTIGQLRKGSKSNEVKQLQQQLIDAGYKLDKYGADGTFGPETEKALKELQKALGVEQTGIWDEATKKAADSAKVFQKTATKTSKVANIAFEKIKKGLKKGMRSDDVKKLQEELKKAGYGLDKFGADGIFGPETEKALKKLQTELGVNATGVWDEATEAAIKNKKATEEAAKAQKEMTNATKEANAQQDEAEEKTRRTTDAMTFLKSILQGVGAAFNILKGAFGAVVQIGKNFLSQFEPLLGPMAAFLSMFSAMLWNFEADIDDQDLFGSFVSAVSGLFQPLGDAIQWVADKMWGFLYDFGNFLYARNLPTTFENFFEFIKLYVGEDTPLGKLLLFAENVAETLVLVKDTIVDILSSAFTGLASGFGFTENPDQQARMSPIVQVLNFILDMANLLVVGIYNVIYTLGPIISGVLAEITPQIIPTLQMIGGLLKTALELAVALLPQIIPLVPLIIAAVVAIKALNTTSKIAGGRNGIARLIPLVGALLGILAGTKLKDKIKVFLKSVYNTLIKKFPKLEKPLSSLKDTVKGFFEAISIAFENLKNRFPNITDYLSKKFEAFNKLFEWNKEADFGTNILNIFTKVTTAIGDKFTSLWATVSGVFESISKGATTVWNFLKSLIPDNVKESIKDFFTFSPNMSFKDNVKSKWQKFINYLKDAFEKLREQLSGLLFSTGENYAGKSALERLKVFFEWLKSTSIGQTLTNVADAVSKAWNSFFHPEGIDKKSGKSMLDVIRAAFDVLWEAAKEIGKRLLHGIVSLFDGKTWSQALGTVLKVISAVTLFNLSRGIASFGKAAKQLTNFELSPIWGAEAKIDTFGDTALKIAAAIGIITAAVFALSKVDAGKAMAGLGVLATLVVGLIRATALIRKLNKQWSKEDSIFGDRDGKKSLSVAKNIMMVGVGIAALTYAIGKIMELLSNKADENGNKKYNEGTFKTAIAIIVGMLVGILVIEAAMMWINKKLGGNKSDHAVSGILEACAGILVLTFAIGHMADLIDRFAEEIKTTDENGKKIKKNKMWELRSAVGMIAGLLAEMALVEAAIAYATAKGGGKGETKISGVLQMCAGILLISFAIGNLAGTIDKLGGEDVAGAFGMIAGIIFEMGALMYLISRSKKGESSVKGILSMCVGVLLVAFAIEDLASSINRIGAGNVWSAFGMIAILILEMGAIAVLLANASTAKGSSTVQVLAGFVGMAGALFVMLSTLGHFVKELSDSNVDLDALWKVIAAIDGLMLVAGIIAIAFGKMDNFKAAIVGAVAVAAIGTALGIAIGAFIGITSAAIDAFGSAFRNLSIMLEAASNRFANINWEIFDTVKSYFVGDNAPIPAFVNAIVQLGDLGAAYDNAVKLSNIASRIEIFSMSLNDADGSAITNATSYMDGIEAIINRINQLTINDSVTEQLTSLAGAINLYYTALSGTDENGEVNTDRIPSAEALRSAFEAMVEAIDPDTVGDIIAYGEDGSETNMNSVATGISALGTAMRAYAEGIGALKSDDVDTANSVLEEFAKITTPNKDIYGNVFKPNGETLDSYVDPINNMGSALEAYGDSIGTLSLPKVIMANWILKTIAKLNQDLPEEAGFLKVVFGGKQTLEDFSTGMTLLGGGIADYVNAVKNVKASDMEESAKVLERFVGIVNSANDLMLPTDFTGDQFDNKFELFGKGIRTMLGEFVKNNKTVVDFGHSLKEFGEGIDLIEKNAPTFNTDTISGVISFVNSIADAVSKLTIDNFVIEGIGVTKFSLLAQGIRDIANDLASLNDTQINGLTVIEQLKNFGAAIGAGLATSIDDDAGENAATMSGSIGGVLRSALDLITSDTSTYQADFNTAGSTIVAWFADAIANNSSAPINQIEMVVTGMYLAVIQRYNDFVRLGKYIDEGLAEGISTNAYLADDAIRELMEKVLATGQEVPEVESPSKKFMWIGKMCALGLRNGIIKDKSLLVDATMDLSQSSLDAIANNLDPSKTEEIADAALKSLYTIFARNRGRALTSYVDVRDWLIACGYLPEGFDKGAASDEFKKAHSRFIKEILGGVPDGSTFGRAMYRTVSEQIESQGYDAKQLERELNYVDNSEKIAKIARAKTAKLASGNEALVAALKASSEEAKKASTDTKAIEADIKKNGVKFEKFANLSYEDTFRALSNALGNTATQQELNKLTRYIKVNNDQERFENLFNKIVETRGAISDAYADASESIYDYNKKQRGSKSGFKAEWWMSEEVKEASGYYDQAAVDLDADVSADDLLSILKRFYPFASDEELNAFVSFDHTTKTGYAEQMKLVKSFTERNRAFTTELGTSIKDQLDISEQEIDQLMKLKPSISKDQAIKEIAKKRLDYIEQNYTTGIEYYYKHLDSDTLGNLEALQKQFDLTRYESVIKLNEQGDGNERTQLIEEMLLEREDFANDFQRALRTAGKDKQSIQKVIESYQNDSVYPQDLDRLAKKSTDSNARAIARAIMPSNEAAYQAAVLDELKNVSEETKRRIWTIAKLKDVSFADALLAYQKETLSEETHKLTDIVTSSRTWAADINLDSVLSIESRTAEEIEEHYQKRGEIIYSLQTELKKGSQEYNDLIQSIIDEAVKEGAIKEGSVTVKNFEDSLYNGWLTSKILNAVTNEVQDAQDAKIVAEQKKSADAAMAEAMSAVTASETSLSSGMQAKKNDAESALDIQNEYMDLLNEMVNGQQESNNLLGQIFGEENTFDNMLSYLGVDSSEIESVKKDLEEKYGSIDFNELIKTGGLTKIQELIDGLGKKYPMLETALNKFSGFMGKGINEIASKVMELGSTLGPDGLNNLLNVDTLIERMKTAGVNVPAGFVEGLLSGKTDLMSSAEEMANTLIGTTMEHLGEHSPSTVFAWIGEMIVAGLANGLKMYADYLTAPMQDITNHLVTVAKESISLMSDVIANDIDISPVIRPVVDMEAIKHSAAQIGETLNSQTLGLGSLEIASRITRLETVSQLNAEKMTANTEALANSVNDLGARVTSLGNDILNLKMYIDGKVLTGYLTPEIDKALGRRYFQASRHV